MDYLNSELEKLLTSVARAMPGTDCTDEEVRGYIAEEENKFQEQLLEQILMDCASLLPDLSRMEPSAARTATEEAITNVMARRSDTIQADLQHSGD